MTNDLQAALPRFERARALDPADPPHRPPSTSASLAKAWARIPTPSSSIRRRRASKSPPRASETLLTGARLLLLLDRFEESETWLQRALKAYPGSRDAHFEYARLLLKKGDAAHAAAEGESALRLSEGVSTDAAIHYLLIRAYQQCGMPDRAALHAEIMRVQETPSGNKAKN